MLLLVFFLSIKQRKNTSKRKQEKTRPDQCIFLKQQNAREKKENKEQEQLSYRLMKEPFSDCLDMPVFM